MVWHAIELSIAGILSGVAVSIYLNGCAYNTALVSLI
jgi:hypothetical protein